MNQIKQITVEIRDIKTRNKIKLDPTTRVIVQDTTSIHNCTSNDPLQISHGKHDEDGEHYVHNKQSIHVMNSEFD